ncbi:MAG TPA: BMP family ABC transporter substrate-binding protein, partial [Clostridia bacterium]|nr:BMP family ABC transporter substrate-binding protein [Clostridia bacterium]
KSFNQGAWEGVLAYTNNNDISRKYYKPEAATDEAYLATIDLAVKGGAKIVVTPGYLFETPVYEAQTKYPEVTFILLDGAPHTADYETYETKPNVASIMYSEQESGFLAGYAAVMDGYRNIGFMGGMAVPAVQAFGYGYLQGAEYAANQLELTTPILATYHYTGDFAETPTNKNTAATIYNNGTQVIFGCGGSVGKSVMAAAAETENGKVIGVDVDQRYDSETVITSATKGLATSVQAVLASIYNGSFSATYGGKTTTFDSQNGGIGLPTMVIGDANANAFDRFVSFNKEAYDAIYQKLVNGDVVVKREITIAAETGVATVEEIETQLGLTKVNVSLVATPEANPNTNVD